jgi:hypothetical protein
MGFGPGGRIGRVTPLPPANPPRRPGSRRFAIIGAAWVLIIGVSAWFGFADPVATDREQTTVAQAQPVVDEAIARVAAAVASDDSAVVAVSGFEHVESCDVTVFRGGERYRRVLVAVVPPGTEADLLARVADHLPAGYQAAVRGGDDPRLTADAGFWVLLTGSVPGPGEVRFAADTGDCRPAGDLAATDAAADVPTDVLPDLLSRLDLAGDNRMTASVSCVDGGVLGTVQATAERYEGDPGRVLDDLDGATIVVDEPNVFAYRTETAQVAVRVHEDATIVTATVGCN